MSYPQILQASAETIEGNDFFRLKTQLASSGDVYEVDTSAKAFAIGPDSDVSTCRVTYYDPSEPGRSQSFLVSTQNPFLGRVDAFASQKYPTENVPAKILVSLEELINTSTAPFGAATGTYSAAVRAQLDLLAFLSPPKVVSLKRADKTYEGLMGFGGAGAETNDIIVPAFGRRYASITAGRFYVDANAPLLSIRGATKVAYGTIPGSFDYITKQIVAPTAIPETSGGTNPGLTIEYRASTAGLFDYLLFSFTRAFAGSNRNPSTQSAIYYRARVSDQEL